MEVALTAFPFPRGSLKRSNDTYLIIPRLASQESKTSWHWNCLSQDASDEPANHPERFRKPASRKVRSEDVRIEDAAGPTSPALVHSLRTPSTFVRSTIRHIDLRRKWGELVIF